MPAAPQRHLCGAGGGLRGSASTAWAYLQPMVALLADQLGCAGDDLPGLVAGKVCLGDGTLLPTVHWRHRRDLFNSPRRRYRMNIQLLVDLHGRLITASRAFPGRWHHLHCFRQAGWVELVAGSGGGIADPGYQRAPDAVRTPIKKRSNTDLCDLERHLNRGFAKIQVGAEWGVSHLKNWRLLTTRYRSDLSRIDTDIQAIVGL